MARTTRSGRARPRGRWLLGYVTVLVALAGAAFLLGTRVADPGTLAASAAPPAAVPVTVAVEDGALATRSVFRADVTHAGRAVPRLAEFPSPATVTRVTTREGDELTAGDVLVEVRGRPVLACEGGFAPYRDFEIGMSGPDVELLQRCLQEAGRLGDEQVDGVLGEGTIEAVAALFRSVGHDLAAERDPADLAALASAQRQVTLAQTQLSEAGKAVAAASAERERAIGRAEKELASAASRLADADATGASSEDRAELQAAVREAERALTEARASTVDGAESTRLAAEASLDEAQSALATARRNATIRVPAHLIGVLPGLPASVVAVGTQEGDDLAAIEVPVATAGSQLQLTASIPADDEVATRLLRRGATVDARVEDELTTIRVTDVEASGDAVALSAELADGSSVRSDTNVRVEIVGESAPEDALLVPVSALRRDASGGAYLWKWSSPAQERVRVQVDVVLTSEGMAAVLADAIEPGDQVVVSSA